MDKRLERKSKDILKTRNLKKRTELENESRGIKSKERSIKEIRKSTKKRLVNEI